MGKQDNIKHNKYKDMIPPRESCVVVFDQFLIRVLFSLCGRMLSVT